MSEQTIYQMFQATVRQHGGRPALRQKVGKTYEDLTYTQLDERVRAFRRGLRTLGMTKGDRVAILSENRVEWTISDLACQSLGVVTVPIYPTLTAPQVQYQVSDAAVRVLVVSNKKQMEKALALRPHVRSLEHILLMDADALGEGEPPEGIQTFTSLLAQSGSPDALDTPTHSEPDDIATIIYTSGTTGDPKGAVLSHRALLHTAWAAKRITRFDETDVFLSFLPLCHIFERVAGHYLPLSVGAQIVYSEGVFAVAGELTGISPTVFFCVPRLYETMHERILDSLAKMPEKPRRMAEWAMGVGKACAERIQAGRSIGPFLALKRRIADKLVLSKIRAKSVGQHARFFVSGGAPLNPTTALFFESLNLPILEGYGLTECPVIAVNHPDKRQVGTVGIPLEGLEVRIAEDGEILARGPSRMRGYFGKLEATGEAIDTEGWFHTGDVGEFTPRGFLKITDRKKDILVLANGKKVAPQPIEAHLKESPYIAELVLLGDRQATLAAIVVPAFDKLKQWAKEQEFDAHDMAALLRRAETKKLFKSEIDRLSDRLADFEKIKQFRLVEHPFSIESGELTPTLKVKRKFIVQKYAELIAEMAR